jgi:ankyrin repeat protein
MTRVSRRVILAAALAAGTTGARAQGDLTGMALELHAAAAANDAGAIRKLAAAGAPVEARDKARRTALLIATRANAVEAVAALIDAGADVNAKDNIRDTPFLYAGAEGRLEILRLCLKAGANLKDTNRYGGTALIPAAHHGHPETVRELLKTDIAIDHVNRLGWTALLEIIILSDGGPTHQDILGQLIAAGADVNLADGEGVAPLAHAKNRGYSDMIRMLEAAGAR